MNLSAALSGFAARLGDGLRHPGARRRILNTATRAAAHAQDAETWAPVHVLLQVHDGRVEEVATAYLTAPDTAPADLASTLRTLADHYDPPARPLVEIPVSVTDDDGDEEEEDVEEAAPEEPDPIAAAIEKDRGGHLAPDRPVLFAADADEHDVECIDIVSDGRGRSIVTRWTEKRHDQDDTEEQTR